MAVELRAWGGNSKKGNKNLKKFVRYNINKNKLCLMTCGRVPKKGASEINKILFQQTDYSL